MSGRRPFVELESTSEDEPEIVIPPGAVEEIQRQQIVNSDIVEERVNIEDVGKENPVSQSSSQSPQTPELDEDPEGLNEILEEGEPDFDAFNPNATVPSLEEIAITNMYTLHKFTFQMADSVLVSSGRVKREGLVDKLEMNQEGLLHAYRGIIRKYGDRELIKRMNDPLMLLAIMSAGMIASHIAENK